nr:hypothetical protein [Tanacetum cinerariifolium]
MGYEHFSTTLVTELNEVIESSTKNLVLIPRECEVTSNESESNEPVKDDSSAFTTSRNPLFNDSNDFTSNDEDVSIEESRVHSNPLFDDDEINSDELESHAEYNFVESLSTYDALIDSSQKIDYLEEFSRSLIPIHITEEERIRREHADYSSHLIYSKVFSFLFSEESEDTIFDPGFGGGNGSGGLSKSESSLSDALDSAAGGNFLDKIPRECLSIIESNSKVRYLRSRVTNAKSSIEEPEHSFSMGYEHFSTTLVTELNEVIESSTKNLVLIPRECEVTSNESESNELVKDDSSAFTTSRNPIFNDSNDFMSNDEDVPIEESRVHSNPLFDDDEINSDELESHAEYNFVESLSTYDALIDSSQKIDYLEEFSRSLIPIHITEEERIRREHADYSSRMEMLFSINPRPRLTVNANTNVDSIPSSLIPVQDNDFQWEEIDIITNTDVLPSGFENDDSDGEIDAVDELHVDNSISNSENELSDNEESDFDNPLYPRPPPKPPDAEFDVETNAGEEISVVMNNELECLDPRDEIDNEEDDYFSFMFVIRIFLPDLIYSKVFSFLFSAESEDTIFDHGKDYAQNVKNQAISNTRLEVYIKSRINGHFSSAIKQ